ncbi:hypothetical protein PIB30_091551 [Stylosanthes scabra]|uniref:Uncharacterized protein n=1 Tax=Stylosanthes scabra TaxID=79078 RepID=A0ABU6ZT77_9FABA|nr:hypothetical protein [Stylosanthes scabra]
MLYISRNDACIPYLRLCFPHTAVVVVVNTRYWVLLLLAFILFFLVFVFLLPFFLFNPRYLISFFPYLEELYEVGTPPKPKKGILGVGTKVADKESLFGTNLQFAVLSVLR